MSIAASLAIYFIMWWLTLFAILPFGVRSQVEAGAVVPGSEPGAPHRAAMLRNVLWTTVVSGVLFTLYYVNYTQGFITLDDIPFLPRAAIN
jgi:predicted secreted protein